MSKISMCEIVGEGHNGPHTSNDAARKPQIIFSYVCIAIFGLLSVKHFDTVTSGTPLRNCGIQLNGESKLFSDFSKYRLNSLFNRDCVYSDRQAATMAVEKGDRQLVVTVDKQNVCDADTQAAIPHSVPSAQFCDTQLPALTRRQRVLRGIAHHLHIATFLPLVLISALRSIDIMVAAVVCTTVVLCILFLSFCAYKAGYVQIFPKPYDLFNLSLYGSMVVLSLCAHDWMLTYIGLLTNGGNAIFMWVTILLPWMDNFVMHTVKDRVAPELVHHHLIRRMALSIALSWATALTIMTAGAIIPIVLANLHIKPYRATIIATHVLGFAPLLLAVVVQHIISFIYRKKVRSQCITPVQQKQQKGVLQTRATQAHAVQATRQPKHQSAGGSCGDNAV